MSIYDFTAEELEEIRRADAEMERRRIAPKPKTTTVKSENWGGDRRSSQAKAKHINHLGNALWEYRVMRGLNQRQLADRMHICQQSISDMERGKSPINAYARDFLRKEGVAI